MERAFPSNLAHSVRAISKEQNGLATLGYFAERVQNPDVDDFLAFSSPDIKRKYFYGGR